MMEAQIEVKRGFWASLLTGPRVVAFIVSATVFVSGGAMWIQAVRSEIEQLRERVVVLEQRVGQESATTALVYMRRDVLASELAAIRDEQTRIRELVQLLRKDLR